MLDTSKFQVLNPIGQGSFGNVYRVKDVESNKIYAAKVLNISKRDYDENSQQILFLFREINIMALEYGIKGTLLYIAPEIFAEKPYSEKSDVYAFSIIII